MKDAARAQTVVYILQTVVYILQTVDYRLEVLAQMIGKQKEFINLKLIVFMTINYKCRTLSSQCELNTFVFTNLTSTMPLILLAKATLTQTVSGLSPRRQVFVPWQEYVEFFVDRMRVGQDFLRIIPFLTTNIFPQVLYTNAFIIDAI